MAQNIEVKAYCNDPARSRKLAKQISDKDPEIINQVDTFFKCNNGRLKLREFGDGTGELIHYNRDTREIPTLSQYIITSTDQPVFLKESLSRALGIRAVVEKRREVSLSGRTRIHIDEVKSLGTFLELEVVLLDNELHSSGVEEAKRLMKDFEIQNKDLLGESYVDLLEKAAGDCEGAHLHRDQKSESNKDQMSRF